LNGKTQTVEFIAEFVVEKFGKKLVSVFFFSTEAFSKRKRRIFIKRVANPFSDRLKTGTRSGQVTVQQIARGERLLFCYKTQENWFSANVAKAQCDK
jgi:hypothetical protein